MPFRNTYKDFGCQVRDVIQMSSRLFDNGRVQEDTNHFQDLCLESFVFMAYQLKALSSTTVSARFRICVFLFNHSLSVCMETGILISYSCFSRSWHQTESNVLMSSRLELKMRIKRSHKLQKNLSRTKTPRPPPPLVFPGLLVATAIPSPSFSS